MSENKDIVVQEADHQPISPFGSVAGFEVAQRMAQALASSTFTPKEFKNNVGDCLIVLETAARTNMPIMALLQNMYVVYGKPSFSSAFMAGLINSSGRFDGPLRYIYNDQRTACYALATSGGEEYRGVTVTLDMAQKEGWATKKGSKWVTMPELMLQYRAISFFARAYCADIIMGIRSVDEVLDSGVDDNVIDVEVEEDLNAKFSEPEKKPETEPEPEEETTKPVRSKPAVVRKFKEEIDAIENHLHMDRWRMKHLSRIERELPKKEDREAVFAYAESHYKALKHKNENRGEEPQEEKFFDCPDGNGKTPDSFCVNECKKVKGCPARA